MAVLVAKTHTARLEGGDAVLTAAETADTKPIAAKLARFRKAHGALRAADEALGAAEEKLRAAQQKVAEADVDQDDRVDALANVLVSIGLPRVNPFKGLSPVVPSRMKVMGYGDEAAALVKLTAKVRKRKGLTPAVAAACKEAERAAKSVVDALAPIGKLEGAVTTARTRRDALTQPWETAFSVLKRGARSADDDGAAGLFDTLFRTTAEAPAPKKPRAKKTPPA